MSTTIEDQLHRYGQHLAELEALGQLVPDGSPPPAGPRRGAVVLVAVLALFVAAVVGVALRAGTSTSSPPATEVPPPTTEVDPSEAVPLLALPDEGGTACLEGLCVTLSHPGATEVGTYPAARWLVEVRIDGSEGGGTGWSPCSDWGGLGMGGSGDPPLLWGLTPAETRQVAVPGLEIRQLRVATSTDLVSVLVATGGTDGRATYDAVYGAVERYLPDPEATPQSCRDQWNRQREEMERRAGDSSTTVTTLRAGVTTTYG
jgi:hypothetical protein